MENKQYICELYVNNWIVHPLFFREIKKIDETENYLITTYFPPYDIEYQFYLGVNDKNSKAVAMLKPGSEMIIEATPKKNKAGMYIFRIRRIIVGGVVNEIE